MIADDFKIDFENKRIFYSPQGSGKIYSVNELYSYLQDTFDEPINMKYDIPIEAKPGTGRHPAKSKTKYLLINGWTIDEKGLKHLKGSILTITI